MLPQRASPLRAAGVPVQRGDSSTQVTELLVRWRGGDREALDSLMPLVYEELRRIARHYLKNERIGHTLQSTALVNEAYVRLVGQDFPEWRNRAHFFAVAAQLMRQILVDHARSYRAAKRGGDACKIALDEAAQVPCTADVDVIALDEALKTLAKMNQQQSQVVELKFFGGLSLMTRQKYWEFPPPPSSGIGSRLARGYTANSTGAPSRDSQAMEPGAEILAPGYRTDVG